jgi:hypothetical protein
MTENKDIKNEVPKVRNAVLELCNKLQRRAVRMRDRRKRRAKSYKNSWKNDVHD